MAERWFLLLRYLCIWETLVLDGRTQPSNESISMLFILHAIFFFLTFSFPPSLSHWLAWLLNRDNKIRAGIAVTDYGATRNPSLSILALISHPDLAAKKAFIVSGYRQSLFGEFLFENAEHAKQLHIQCWKNGSFVSLVHEDVRTKCFRNPLSVLNRQAMLVVVCFF